MTQLQIDCFLAAVRTGSLTAAAREVYISPQAVSQHIQNLESELSAPLFTRSSSGVSLTPEGKEFLSFALRLTGLYSSTVNAIREQYRNMSRQLTIGLSDYIDVVGQISGGLTEFARLHPEAEIKGVQYSNREIMAAISDGSIDAAIMSDSQIFAGGDFDIYPFAREELRLYVSHVPELPPDCTLKQAAEICKSLPHLDASYGPWSDDEWLEIAKRMSARLGLSADRRVIMPNFRSVIETVGLTRCTAVCDARFGFLQDTPELRSFPLDADASLCVVSERNNENPLIVEFRDYMKDYYA